MWGAAHIGVQGAQTTDQHRHLGGGQGQQLRLVDQALGRRVLQPRAGVVAEAVGDRLQHGKGVHVGLRLRGVRAARREGHAHRVACRLRRRLDRSAAAQHDQVRERDALAAGLRSVECRLHRLQRLQHTGQLGRLVDRPVLLRRQADTRPIGPTALVAATESGGRGPSRRDQLRNRQPAGQQLRLQRGDVLRVDQRVVDGGHRVLPQQRFLRHQRAEVTRHRPHVTVRQLEPGAGKRIGELLRVRQEAPRDRLVGRVDAQRQIGGQHGGGVALAGVVRIRHRAGTSALLRCPLVRARGALGQLPLEAEQVLEEVVAPAGGRRGPGDFETAADRVPAPAGAEAAGPAETLRLDARGFRLGADVLGVPCAVGLAEGVTAGDQRHGLLVVHGHAGEGFADVAGGSQRIRVPVRAFRVHVDQAHLHGRERVLQRTVAGVALVGEPGLLGAPVDVLLRFPDVHAPAGIAEGLEAHRLQRHVAGQDHQVGPRDLAAVLLLDRPEQPAGLVEVDVVRPAVQRREPLVARAGATPAVLRAVGAGAVPGHADEQRAVVAEVGGPPVLRVGHQGVEILHDGVQVEALEGLGVVEVRAQRIGLRRVLVQEMELELPRPPAGIRWRPRGHLWRRVERALGGGRGFDSHGTLLR